MSYVLEANAKEFERLERQSLFENYDFKRELKGFHVNAGAQVLDAGCGSGIVSRYLARQFSQTHITGCDAAVERLALAKASGEGVANLDFQVEDLAALSFGANRFDAIVCRYVLQHASVEVRKRIVSELLRVLKPGGKLYVIETDGLLVNLYPCSKEVAQVIDTLIRSGPVDFHVGRKIPMLLREVGFESSSTHAETADYDEQSIGEEVQMMAERFENAQPFFAGLLGSSELAQRFFDRYLAEMRAPGAYYFFNKFVVTGTKKESALRVVSTAKTKR